MRVAFEARDHIAHLRPRRPVAGIVARRILAFASLFEFLKAFPERSARRSGFLRISVSSCRARLAGAAAHDGTLAGRGIAQLELHRLVPLAACAFPPALIDDVVALDVAEGRAQLTDQIISLPLAVRAPDRGIAVVLLGIRKTVSTFSFRPIGVPA